MGRWDDNRISFKELLAFFPNKVTPSIVFISMIVDDLIPFLDCAMDLGTSKSLLDVAHEA